MGSHTVESEDSKELLDYMVQVLRKEPVAAAAELSPHAAAQCRRQAKLQELLRSCCSGDGSCTDCHVTQPTSCVGYLHRGSRLQALPPKHTQSKHP